MKLLNYIETNGSNEGFKHLVSIVRTFCQRVRMGHIQPILVPLEWLKLRMSIRRVVGMRSYGAGEWHHMERSAVQRYCNNDYDLGAFIFFLLKRSTPVFATAALLQEKAKPVHIETVTIKSREERSFDKSYDYRSALIECPSIMSLLN